MNNTTAVLIMAAGEASRFQDCKQLALLSGKSLLQRTVDCAMAVFPGHVFVVTGAYRQSIESSIENANFIYNPSWKSGLGSSIAHGVSQLPPNYEAVLIMLADQVAIETQDLERLQHSFSGNLVACAKYQGGRGVPALFHREVFPELAKLNGDKGAKALLYKKEYQVAEVALENAAIDIDTFEDLQDVQLTFSNVSEKY